MTMQDLINELRRQGWRVRDGGWPNTRQEEERWDFCQTKSKALGWCLWSMSSKAGDAVTKIMRELQSGQ